MPPPHKKSFAAEQLALRQQKKSPWLYPARTMQPARADSFTQIKQTHVRIQQPKFLGRFRETLRMALFILAILVGMVASPAYSQTIVPVHEEPRHHFVYDGDGFCVLDVQIAPGDTTLFHTHDAPVAYVAIDTSLVDTQPLGGEWRGTPSSDGPLRMLGGVVCNLDYARESLTHRVKTVGTNPFRLIAIINYGFGAADSTGLPQATIGDVEAENPWFRVSRLTLNPGQVIVWDSSDRPVVAVLVTEGRVVAARHKKTAELSARGSFFVQEAGEEHELRNPASTSLKLVFVAVR